MDINADPPPFFPHPQPFSSMPRRRSFSSSSSSPPLISLPVLIILVPILTLLLLFFTIPPFLSFTFQILRTHAVRKSWDSLNIFLVLFAILCGIFARGNDDGSTSTGDGNQDAGNFASEGMREPGSQQWFEYSDRKMFDDNLPAFETPATRMSRLKRNSSSYPDLRQESVWEAGGDGVRFRFYDDFEVNKYRSSAPHYVNVRRRENDFGESEVKEIPVDTIKLRSCQQPAPKKSPPPPPRPPPRACHHKSRRVYHKVSKEKVKHHRDPDQVMDKIQTPPRTPPPPPPPPPRPASPLSPEILYQSEDKKERSGHGRRNARKEIKMFVASLYKQKKRKKKHRIKNTYESQTTSDSNERSSFTIPPPSPPTPPPPPSPSVFQSLFKKGSKSKKIHSFSPPPPPPPPPPQSSKRASNPQPKPPPPAPPPPPQRRSSRRRTQMETPPPATNASPSPPTRVANDARNDNVNIGNQAPQIPLPPPPPPPPFRMPPMKFVVRGDFLRVGSTRSSRCSSPEPQDIEVSSEAVNVIGSGDGLSSAFCASPDVNVKADTFIARLKDEWRLEKMNSLREKQKTGLGLKPSTGIISSRF